MMKSRRRWLGIIILLLAFGHNACKKATDQGGSKVNALQNNAERNLIKQKSSGSDVHAIMTYMKGVDLAQIKSVIALLEGRLSKNQGFSTNMLFLTAVLEKLGHENREWNYHHIYPGLYDAVSKLVPTDRMEGFAGLKALLKTPAAPISEDSLQSGKFKTVLADLQALYESKKAMYDRSLAENKRAPGSLLRYYEIFSKYVIHIIPLLSKLTSSASLTSLSADQRHFIFQHLSYVENLLYFFDGRRAEHRLPIFYPAIDAAYDFQYYTYLFARKAYVYLNLIYAQQVIAQEKGVESGGAKEKTVDLPAVPIKELSGLMLALARNISHAFKGYPDSLFSKPGVEMALGDKYRPSFKPIAGVHFPSIYASDVASQIQLENVADEDVQGEVSALSISEDGKVLVKGQRFVQKDQHSAGVLSLFRANSRGDFDNTSFLKVKLPAGYEIKAAYLKKMAIHPQQTSPITQFQSQAPECVSKKLPADHPLCSALTRRSLDHQLISDVLAKHDPSRRYRDNKSCEGNFNRERSPIYGVTKQTQSLWATHAGVDLNKDIYLLYSVAENMNPTTYVKDTTVLASFTKFSIFTYRLQIGDEAHPAGDLKPEQLTNCMTQPQQDMLATGNLLSIHNDVGIPLSRWQYVYNISQFKQLSVTLDEVRFPYEPYFQLQRNASDGSLYQAKFDQLAQKNVGQLIGYSPDHFMGTDTGITIYGKNSDGVNGIYPYKVGPASMVSFGSIQRIGSHDYHLDTGYSGLKSVQMDVQSKPHKMAVLDANPSVPNHYILFLYYGLDILNGASHYNTVKFTNYLLLDRRKFSELGSTKTRANIGMQFYNLAGRSYILMQQKQEQVDDAIRTDKKELAVYDVTFDFADLFSGINVPRFKATAIDNGFSMCIDQDQVPNCYQITMQQGQFHVCRVDDEQGTCRAAAPANHMAMIEKVLVDRLYAVANCISYRNYNQVSHSMTELLSDVVDSKTSKCYTNNILFRPDAQMGYRKVFDMRLEPSSQMAIAGSSFAFSSNFPFQIQLGNQRFSENNLTIFELDELEKLAKLLPASTAKTDFNFGAHSLLIRPASQGLLDRPRKLIAHPFLQKFILGMADGTLFSVDLTAALFYSSPFLTNVVDRIQALAVLPTSDPSNGSGQNIQFPYVFERREEQGLHLYNQTTSDLFVGQFDLLDNRPNVHPFKQLSLAYKLDLTEILAQSVGLSAEQTLEQHFAGVVEKSSTGTLYGAIELNCANAASHRFCQGVAPQAYRLIFEKKGAQVSASAHLSMSANTNGVDHLIQSPIKTDTRRLVAVNQVPWRLLAPEQSDPVKAGNLYLYYDYLNHDYHYLMDQTKPESIHAFKFSELTSYERYLPMTIKR